MLKKIITHSGPSHFDEFFAICLVLAETNDDFEIVRREPTDDELKDPNVWVIDVGNVYNPALKDFDHHQYAGGDSAFVLVADYFGLKEILSNLPWFNIKSKLDTLGSTQVCKELEIKESAFFFFTVSNRKGYIEYFC